MFKHKFGQPKKLIASWTDCLRTKPASRGLRAFSSEQAGDPEWERILAERRTYRSWNSSPPSLARRAPAEPLDPSQAVVSQVQTSILTPLTERLAPSVKARAGWRINSLRTIRHPSLRFKKLQGRRGKSESVRNTTNSIARWGVRSGNTIEWIGLATAQRVRHFFRESLMETSFVLPVLRASALSQLSSRAAESFMRKTARILEFSKYDKPRGTGLVCS